MKGTEETRDGARLQITPSERETQLIDLFVEMCFFEIRSPAVLYQFKLVAQKLEYTDTEIERVVSVGKSEYEKMYKDIEKQIMESFS